MVGMGERAELVLLDRDGVLNRNLDQGVRTLAEWTWLPGALDALALLATDGRQVAVVTNQANLGRGLTRAADVERIHGEIVAAASRAGLAPVHVLVCPHIPAAGCGCRKPRPGLLRRAMQLASVPPSRTLLVGDHTSDLMAAAAAGCRSVHVLCGRGAALKYSWPGYLGSLPDLLAVAEALREGVLDR